MKEKITAKLTELFCPQNSPATGGEQLPTGNKYPNAEQIDLLKHVNGEKTYALDVCSDGICKFGVLDIDQSDDEGLETARSIKSNLESSGINSLLSFSGSKGYHVTIISEPVPRELMVNALKKVRARFKFKGELIPGDAQRCKPAPCLHQAAGNMSYYFQDKPYGESFGLNDLPEGFYESQLELLEQVKPTPANVLIVFASKEDKGEEQPNLDDMVPDFTKARDELTPCIKALVERGGASSLGTWDKNSLVLASYCSSRGLNKDQTAEIGKQLVRNSENGPVETSKSIQARLDHFLSIQNTPSVTDKNFNCAYMLKARRELKFSCNRCAVRPKGIKANLGNGMRDQKNPLQLEITLAKDLISYILSHGVPVENILPDIMPEIDYKKSQFLMKSVTCNVLRVFIKAIYEGATSEIALAEWLDKDLSENRISSYFGNQLHNDEIPQGTEDELRNKYLTLFKQLREKEPVSAEQYQKILSRAVDLSLRTQIKRRAEVLDKETYDLSKDIFTVNSEFTNESTRILSDSQRGALVPLAEKYDHLLQYILGDGAGKIPTPFPALNDLLGGGLANGSKYVVVSPPGGGKTTICTQIADYAATNGIPTIFVSMEMSMEHIYVNSIARLGEINSAKIMSPYREIKEKTLERVGEIAAEYQQTAAANIHIVEGNYNTTPARLETLVSVIRAHRKMSKDDPILVVIDYLQLLNTGIEAMDMGPNETIKISELAVRIKQLARDMHVAVVAISDVTKEEQKGTFQSKEFTMNALRGSNRIAHAADCIMVLYSEPGHADGGKAEKDAWEVFTHKVKGSEQAMDFVTNLKEFKEENPVGGEGATVYARLELIKNRGGQGKGNQFLLFHRAFHKFEPAEIEGQKQAEGRG